MNRIICLFIVLTVLTTPVFSQGMMDKKGQMMHADKKMKTRMSMKGHHGMYTMMLNHIIMKAQGLDLSEKQEKNLAAIREKYLYPAVEKDADFRIAHMKIMSKLHDPEFDPEDLKERIKTANDISVELANMYIDGLAEVRSTIGIGNFKKIIKPVPIMMQDGMMNDDSNEAESEDQQQ